MTTSSLRNIHEAGLLASEVLMKKLHLCSVGHEATLTWSCICVLGFPSDLLASTSACITGVLHALVN